VKIAFVYPATEFDIINHKDSLPNGLLYLAAVIEKENVAEVSLFDARHGEALPANPSEFDVIGFTAMSMQIDHAVELVQKVREQGFTGKIVFGGPHATVAPESLMQNPMIDAVFLGESEISFLLYLQFLNGTLPAPPATVLLRKATHAAFVAEDDGAPFAKGTTPVEYVKDLDSLPFPARHHFAHVLRKIKFVNIFTCRGCPYNCEFCQPTKRILFGNKIRSRTAENIFQEIAEAVRLYGVTGFSIDDDTFTYNRKRILDFCAMVKNLGLLWSCQSRSDISEETLVAMRDAGCWLIFVGVESGSQRVLELMGKKNNIENNKQFIETCNGLGIKTWCNIMVGYPGETVQDLELTRQFVLKTKPTRACVSQATPFPGTDLYNKHKDDLLPIVWDRLARHIPYPRFKSMEHMQEVISLYQNLCSTGWDRPLEP
jgi:radical SAM superfamily enzyme YgiQ (UPF0313 family)